VGQVKSISTKHIRRAGFPDFAWQPRFWDRVIRSESEHIATRQYIHKNPLRWHDDQYYPAVKR
jgi:REP element-mobilizing transposase RayT